MIYFGLFHFTLVDYSLLRFTLVYLGLLRFTLVLLWFIIVLLWFTIVLLWFSTALLHFFLSLTNTHRPIQSCKFLVVKGLKVTSLKNVEQTIMTLYANIIYANISENSINSVY